MSTTDAPTASTYRWTGDALEFLDYCDMADTTIEVADSWLVSEGRTLALELHRSRFLDSIARSRYNETDPVAFWDAALALVPREGDWFPRVELQSRGGAPLFVFRLRSAPARGLTAVLASHAGADPRTSPTVKGPDLEAMLRLRTEAQEKGADEAVILSPDGYVVEGAYSAIVWWRGAILCAASPDLERVDSVTARSLLGMAAALGVETYEESVTPTELDGCEVWALSALHGPRIITRWVDGPSLAALPGRLDLWRTRLAVLRRPLPA